MGHDIAKLRASVRLLRVVALVLVIALAILLLAPLRSPGAAAEGSSVVNVAAQARAIVDERGLDANRAEFFLTTPELTAHLHFMGRRHHCPLHVHPRGHEATVIVEGEAEVRHVFRRDGAFERAARTFGEGALVASPPACAHAFTNTSTDRALVNLVFSSPAFDHNTYLESDSDDRIGSDAPTSYVFADEIRAFAAGTDATRRIPLGAMAGSMSLVLVRTKTTIEPRGAVSAVYVLEGTGTITADRRLDVGPKDLAIVRHRAPFALEATGASVVAALVVVSP